MRPRARRVLKITAIVVVAILLCFAAIAWRIFSRLLAEPLPVPAQAVAGAPERLVVSPEAARVGEQIRLHGLVTGETVVPFGQFFGGLEGWVGAAAIYKGGLGGEKLWVPVPVMVIVHPTEGVILVDTGLSAAQCDAFAYYSVLDGGLNAGIWRDSANRLAPEGGLVPQLAAIGIAPKDVRHIVITHLHEDHVGEVAAFPGATVHVSELEHTDRARVSYEPSFAAVEHWDRFAYDSGAYGGFQASKDLLGDGTVVLLPTPGHTLGHTAVLVHLGDHHALVAGDALYTLRHLDPDALASFNYFGEQGLATYQDSVRRMAGLPEALGAEVVFVPPHDPFAYGAWLLGSALADGRLSAEERARVSAETAAILDEAGHLRPEARPRWAPAEDTGRVTSDVP